MEKGWQPASLSQEVAAEMITEDAGAPPHILSSDCAPPELGPSGHPRGHGSIGDEVSLILE